MSKYNNKIIRITVAFFICISVLLPYTTVVSANSSSLYKASVLIDANTLKVLSEKNKDTILPQASVTKLMTYLVVMDELKEASVPLTKKITVNTDLSIIPVDGSKLNLKNGDVITIGQLIESLLIISANDSAIVLEGYVESLTKKDFVNLMNEKAKEIGLSKTKFINTSGLTEENKTYNTTTAYEIAILSKKIIDNYPETLKITSKESFTYSGLKYPSTNKLLSKEIGVDGLKTGFTNEAGYCLSSTVNIKDKDKNNMPYRVIAVTLGSKTDDERVRGNLELLNFAKKNYVNKILINKDNVYSLSSEYHVGGTIEASPSKSEYHLINKKAKITTDTYINEKIRGKVKKGDKVGKIVVKYDDKVEEADLIATKDVKGVNIFKRITLFFKGLFK